MMGQEFSLSRDSELVDILEAAKQALTGVVAMDEEDEGPNGESLTCSEIATRIERYLQNGGKSDG
jgi:hypothetical protein